MRFILFLFFFLFSAAYAVDRDCRSPLNEQNLALSTSSTEQAQELETLINSEFFTKRFFLSAHANETNPSLLEITLNNSPDPRSFFSRYPFWLFSFFPYNDSAAPSFWKINMQSDNDRVFFPNSTSLILALANIEFYGLLPKTITGLPPITFDLLIHHLGFCQPINNPNQHEKIDFSIWEKTIGIPLSDDWWLVSDDLDDLLSFPNEAPLSFQKIEPKEKNTLNNLERIDYQCRNIKPNQDALNRELHSQLNSNSFNHFQTQKTILFRHMTNLSESFLNKTHKTSYCTPLPDQRLIDIEFFKSALNDVKTFFSDLLQSNCLDHSSSKQILSPKACSYLNFLFELSDYYSISLL